MLFTKSSASDWSEGSVGRAVNIKPFSKGMGTSKTSIRERVFGVFSYSNPVSTVV